jgi:Tol biopolymer transport system component
VSGHPDLVAGQQWIAYLAESPNFDVMVVSADGGEARQMTSERAFERPIAWLPDGSGIVYVKQGNAFETYVVMLADSRAGPHLGGWNGRGTTVA